MGTFVNPFGSQTASQPSPVSSPSVKTGTTKKPVQTSKFVNPFAGQTISQPTTQPKPQSNGSIISDPNAIKDIQRQAGEALNQPQGFLQTIFTKSAPVIGQALQFAKETVKQVKDFLPKTGDYAKQAVKNPVDTAAGGGAAQLKFFGSLAGLVQKGVASVTGITVPERWDISKQVEALDELNKTLIEKTSKSKEESDSKQKAFATGQFLGQILPYALVSEVAGASIGAKILVPSAQKFLPGAIKFIPKINEAISVLGVDQIAHEEKNGTRVDQLKNSLIMLSMFEVGGLAFKGLSKGTKSLISKTLDDIKGKPKIDFEITQPKIDAVKAAIKEDTGKSMEVLATQEMANGKVPSVPGEVVNRKVTDLITHEAAPDLAQIAKYKEEIQAGGKPPLVVMKEGNKFGVEDGKHKLEAYKQLGIDEVPTIEKIVPEMKGTTPSKLGLRVEQTAIEKKLTNELKDLPTYEKMTMKDEAKKATDLINADPQKAFDIALGKELPPSGVKAESIFKAVEASITTPEQALQLAKSPLVREASELGQRIKALDVKTSESPVEAIKQVLNARAKAIEGKFESVDRATAKIVKNIESKVKAPDKYDWNKFVESIKC